MSAYKLPRVETRVLRDGASPTWARPVFSHEEAVRCLGAHIADQATEWAWVLYLDGRMRAIGAAELSRGSVGCVSMSPRTIVQGALGVNASAVILAHNHPSGDPTPSDADIAATRSLAPLLAQLDITLLDHAVVARDLSGNVVTLSMRHQGVVW